ncbi:hypothetical protein F01_140034 [Burkholderia cenocepacia]|nr:hypothetical protein F01_140034 [Burkholderia cenocepacia]
MAVPSRAADRAAAQDRTARRGRLTGQAIERFDDSTIHRNEISAWKNRTASRSCSNSDARIAPS